MTDIRITPIALAAAGLLALPAAGHGQAGSAPKPVALCLPPGSPKPVNCGIARAGQSIRLQVATTTLPPGPITLLFAEETATGRVPVRALLTVPGGRSLDGGYDVVVPRELCAGRTQASGNFEIQYLMSEINQAEGSGPSLGALTVAC